jgi:sugar diacid utilization regulator
MEFGSRFGPLDMHIARRAATNAALELSAERRAARAEWDARSSLAGELIRGNPDGVALRRRAEYLGVDLDASHVVCLVGTDGPGAGALPTAAQFSAAFAQADGARAALATGVTEGMLVVLALDAGVPAIEAVGRVRDRVAEVLERLRAPALRLVGAVSTRCGAPADFPGAYRQAQQVMACMQSFGDTGRATVLTADDLGPGRLFLASSSREEADRFAHDALSALLVEGDDAMADLLMTLRMFFDNSRSVRKSAQALDVHENTVRYRLGRIEQLTGLAVGSSSDDQLTAQLALLILRIQGWPGTGGLAGASDGAGAGPAADAAAG